jgi:hypothetical protein
MRHHLRQVGLMPLFYPGFRSAIDAGARNQKFEARNPKFETNSNDKNRENSKQTSLGFGVLDFPDLRFVCLSEFVSDFDIRISDLFFWALGAISFLKPVFPLFLLSKFGPLAHSHAGNLRRDYIGTFGCIAPDLFRQIYIPTRHDKRQRAADGTYAYGNRFNR